MGSSHDDLYSLARELSEGTTEAHLRSCASRAYYASYHLCKDYADKNKIPFKQELKKVHEALITRFTQYSLSSTDPEKQRNIRAVGHILNQARDLRVTADYKLVEDFGEKLALAALSYYVNILERLS